MFMHLGNNSIIFTSDLIAILSLDQPVSEYIEDIIEVARLDKKLIALCSEGKEKSAVICQDRIYLSTISSTTLLRRALNPYKEE